LIKKKFADILTGTSFSGTAKMENELQRFLKPQQDDFELALSEIKAGRKKSHWMWYIFPQLKGLGFSDTSLFYGIRDLNEAREYLKHPVLGSRLKQISSELLLIEENNAHRIFGSPDDLKLKSCMTLFSFVDTSEEKIFEKVLKKYFNGESDSKTVRLLK